MEREEILRKCLLGVAAAVAVVGLLTFSFKKMMATYAFGVGGSALLLLPDWEFFDRDFSLWFTPLPAPRRNNGEQSTGSDSSNNYWKFKPYPLRVAVLSIIYCYALYKWWKIVSS